MRKKKTIGPNNLVFCAIFKVMLFNFYMGNVSAVQYAFFVI